MKNYLILFIFLLLLLSCSREEHVTKIESIANISYVKNSSLVREKYIGSKGYLPPEGYISTPQIASNLAFAVLSNVYGEEEIKAQLPFSVNLDHDVWVIEGFIEDGVDGGSAYIEINKQTGEILKILHSK